VKKHFTAFVGGAVDALPSYIVSKCPSAEELSGCLSSLRDCAGGGFLAHTADEYLNFSRLLGSLRTKEDEKQLEDTELSRAVAETLFSLGIGCRRACVRGKRELVIEAYDTDATKIACSSTVLRASLEKACARKLGDVQFIVTQDCTTLRVCSVNALKAEYSTASRAKQGEKANGDTISVFTTDDGRFCSLIGDGMGSGEDASVCSRLSCLFLEKLLSLGADKKDAFALLNKVLIKKGDECFSSLDLFELDMCDGSASLLKAGGAPSFVIRAGKASVLSGRSSPLGILDSLSLCHIRFKPGKGDMVLMVSDGAADSPDDSREMCEFLSSRTFPSTNALALAVLDRASGNTKRDDISVAALKII